MTDLARSRQQDTAVSPAPAWSRRSPVPVGDQRARLDLRARYPLRWMLPIAMVLGAIITTQIVLLVTGTEYSASVQIAVLKLDNGSERPAIQIVDARIQSILSLARSEAFLQEMKIRSGTDMSLSDLSDTVTARRPAIGIAVFLEVSSRDEAVVRELAPHLTASLASLVDKARSGSLVVLNDSGRNAFADADSDYRGPLYLELFGGRPDIGANTPNTTVASFVGAGIGAFVAFGALMLLQGQARASSRDPEELDAVLGVPQVGRLPRLTLRRRPTLSLLRGLAAQIDGQCPRGVERLGMGGSGISRERAGSAIAVAGALSMTLQRRVVLIDADTHGHGLTRRCRLTRHRGVRDLVHGDVALRDTVVELTGRRRERRLPLRYRRQFWRTDVELAIVPIGSEPPEDDDDLPMDALIADVIEQTAREAVVVVALPPLPATHSVQRVMATLDAAVLVLLDGWSSLDDAEENGAAMSSLAPGRVGFILIDN